MTTVAKRATGLLSVAAALTMAAPAAAQQGGRPAPGPNQASPGETTELVYEREVFAYPVFERRNPFRALTGATDGPRFERIRLQGIIYSADPSRSVALLTVAGSTGGASGTGRANRLRVGETWGNIRVLAIERQSIEVEVTEFGITEQRTLNLPNRRSQGGS